MDVRFFDNGARFLSEADAFMAADPLSYSVIATTAARRRSEQRNEPYWFATIREAGEIVAVAMRTHPDPPHAGFTAGMPPAAVSALIAALDERGERVSAWNGDLDAARALCAAVADGGEPEVLLQTRLFEAHRVVPPVRPQGILRQASVSDEALVQAWLAGFHHDSERQGGREPDPSWAPNVHDLRHALNSGVYWLWEVDGQPVHLTGVNPPMLGASRIGPVYTPAARRGRGYAGWVVSQLTQRVLDAGARACLYTDQANPISNLVYERIGYEPVHDEGNVVVRRPSGAGRGVA